MGQCDAPCEGYISKEDYRANILEVLEFLNGNYTRVVKQLEEKMEKASEELEFEKAAEYRDLISNVKKVADRQKITNTDQVDRDIIAFAKEKDEAVVQTFFIRNGKMIGRDNFHLGGVSDVSDGEIMANFLKQFYAGTPYIPKEIYLDTATEDEELLTDWLSAKRGQKVYIKVPQKGDKEKLVELAKKNAELILHKDIEKIKREEAKTTGALKELAGFLNLPIIERIESFDISNTAGFESVGSMVVYEKGKPKKADYRKFKLRTVSGPDDYQSMYEVLTRRFSHAKKELEQLSAKQQDAALGSFTRLPDLILMDGGKGQVGIALRVLEEQQLNIPVCGMVKDDNHHTRGLYYNNQELPIDKSSELFKLITRIQDETHRFAIEYHRSIRNKKQVKSILDDINGIGPKRRRALMKHFASLEAIQSASEEELMQVPTMNSEAAKKVYAFFHQQKSE
jgi:excinuclease ABC subunit C